MPLNVTGVKKSQSHLADLVSSDTTKSAVRLPGGTAEESQSHLADLVASDSTSFTTSESSTPGKSQSHLADLISSDLADGEEITVTPEKSQSHLADLVSSDGDHAAGGTTTEGGQRRNPTWVIWSLPTLEQLATIADCPAEKSQSYLADLVSSDAV